MSERFTQSRRAVLVIEGDAVRRAALAKAVHAVGLPVLAVGAVAEIEQWPCGDIVITDMRHLTPWWRHVGAAEVIVLVRDDEEGSSALQNGATRWLQPAPAPEVVAALALTVASHGFDV